MSRTSEKTFLGTDYVKHGDRLIRNLPLIDTSLYKLREAGWLLYVNKVHVVMHHRTSLRYHFFDPEKPNAFLRFKFWVEGNVPDSKFLSLLLEKDLIPNFNKAPSFRLIPTVEEKPKVITQYVTERVQETELEYLMRTNEEKLVNLRKKGRTEYNDPTGKISNSSERMVS